MGKGKHRKHNPGSQEARILGLLRDRGGWVPAPELAKISLQYSRAIHNLRRAGHEIENNTIRVDGVIHGFFRIAAASAETSQTQSHRAEEARLFPSSSGVGALGL